jgi:hypothetical protein
MGKRHGRLWKSLVAEGGGNFRAAAQQGRAPSLTKNGSAAERQRDSAAESAERHNGLGGGENACREGG